MTCPFCSSEQVERVAQWGGQIITAQWRCLACNSYFEAVREDFDDDRLSAAAAVDLDAWTGHIDLPGRSMTGQG